MRIARIFLRVLTIVCVGLVVLGNVVYKTTAQSDQPGTLTVHADKEVGPINRSVYGANFGGYGGLVPLASVQLALDSGVTYLRYPGGAWPDMNDLQNYEVDLFMGFARQYKAEPAITVRLQKGTPEAAAKMVKYVNVEKKYGVHFWSIGNEPNLFKDYSIEQYVKDWRAIAEAMREVDPTIGFIGPDVSQYPPPSDSSAGQFRQWVTEFLKANGDMVEVVSIHRYPFPAGENPGTKIKDLKSNPQEWDAIIPDLRKTIKEAIDRDLPVAVTEMNSHWTDKVIGDEATPESHYHAVWWADVLGRMIRQRVDMVAYWYFYSGAESGSGIIGKGFVRPTYYTYQLYKKFGTTLVESDSTDKDVSITAALRDDGTLTLMVINPDTEEKSVALELNGFTPGDTQLWRLDPKTQATEVDAPDLSSGTLELPGQSVSLYVVSSK